MELEVLMVRRLNRNEASVRLFLENKAKVFYGDGVSPKPSRKVTLFDRFG